MDEITTAPPRVHNSPGVKAIADLVVDVDHLAIAVEDLETAISWYESLGFTPIERRLTEGEHTSMISEVMTAGRATIVLLQGTSPRSQISRFIEHFGAGIQHLALEVSDLDLALARVREAGGAAEAVTQDEGIRQAFLRREPGSGVRIELIERRGGAFTDSSIRQLFLAFERQDLY
jgi:catechol 2,3-dioxygenase-like lactoylglutathione lyase family enzyme